MFDMKVHVVHFAEGDMFKETSRRHICFQHAMPAESVCQLNISR